jgi:hypothetical protein
VKNGLMVSLFFGLKIHSSSQIMYSAVGWDRSGFGKNDLVVHSVGGTTPGRVKRLERDKEYS